MKRIFESGARFLSRGDQSGTHERERDLWAAAGIDPAAPQIVVAGAGMGQTLRVASATGAYTLTDNGTFLTLAGSLKLRVVVEGDGRLVNTYSVISAPENAVGTRFADWLSIGDGRRVLMDAISNGKIRGFTIAPQ
jgi:tungstate transport system substrate-binding protein